MPQQLVLTRIARREDRSEAANGVGEGGDLRAVRIGVDHSAAKERGSQGAEPGIKIGVEPARSGSGEAEIAAQRRGGFGERALGWAAAVEFAEDRGGGSLSAGDRAVDAFAGQGIGEASSISDEKNAAGMWRRVLCAEAEILARHVLDPRSAVALGDPGGEPGPVDFFRCGLGVQADVEVVALGKHPAVTPPNRGEIEHEAGVGALPRNHGGFEGESAPEPRWVVAPENLAQTGVDAVGADEKDRKSTRLNSSHVR